MVLIPGQPDPQHLEQNQKDLACLRSENLCENACITDRLDLSRSAGSRYLCDSLDSVMPDFIWCMSLFIFFFFCLADQTGAASRQITKTAMDHILKQNLAGNELTHPSYL